MLSVNSQHVPSVQANLLHHEYVYSVMCTFLLRAVCSSAFAAHVSLTTLSQMLQSQWEWCCWMKQQPPKEMSEREGVSREDPLWLFVLFSNSIKLTSSGVYTITGSKVKEKKQTVHSAQRTLKSNVEVVNSVYSYSQDSQNTFASMDSF